MNLITGSDNASLGQFCIRKTTLGSRIELADRRVKYPLPPAISPLHISHTLRQCSTPFPPHNKLGIAHLTHCMAREKGQTACVLS